MTDFEIEGISKLTLTFPFDLEELLSVTLNTEKLRLIFE